MYKLRDGAVRNDNNLLSCQNMLNIHEVTVNFIFTTLQTYNTQFVTSAFCLRVRQGWMTYKFCLLKFIAIPTYLRSNIYIG